MDAAGKEQRLSRSLSDLTVFVQLVDTHYVQTPENGQETDKNSLKLTINSISN